MLKTQAVHASTSRCCPRGKASTREVVRHRQCQRPSCRSTLLILTRDRPPGTLRARSLCSGRSVGSGAWRPQHHGGSWPRRLPRSAIPAVLPAGRALEARVLRVSPTGSTGRCAVWEAGTEAELRRHLLGAGSASLRCRVLRQEAGHKG